MTPEATGKTRNGAAPLPAVLIERLEKIRAASAKETFGVSPSTLARALAGWAVMPGTVALIESRLARLEEVT